MLPTNGDLDANPTDRETPIYLFSTKMPIRWIGKTAATLPQQIVHPTPNGVEKKCVVTVC